MTAMDSGYEYFKFFPASAAGGTEFLRALERPVHGFAFAVPEALLRKPRARIWHCTTYHALEAHGLRPRIRALGATGLALRPWRLRPLHCACAPESDLEIVPTESVNAQ